MSVSVNPPALAQMLISDWTRVVENTRTLCQLREENKNCDDACHEGEEIFRNIINRYTPILPTVSEESPLKKQVELILRDANKQLGKIHSLMMNCPPPTGSKRRAPDKSI